MNDSFKWIEKTNFTKINNIGKVLRYCRILAMETSKDLSEIMCLSYSQLSEIELYNHEVSNEKIIDGMKYLKITADEFRIAVKDVNNYPFSELEKKLKRTQKQNFQQNIRYILIQKKYSIEQFSKLIGANITTVNNWLSGASIPKYKKWNNIFLSKLNISLNSIVQMKLNDKQLSLINSYKKKSISRSEITNFGINLHYFRIKRHYTFEQLSEKANCLTSTIMQWESGANNKTGDKKPPKELLNKISNALRVTQQKLLANSDNEDRNKKFNELKKEKKEKMHAVQVNLKSKMAQGFLTQKKLSEKLDMPVTQVRSWLKGELYPSNKNIKKICKKLNISNKKFFDSEFVSNNEKIINLYKKQVGEYADF